MPHRRLIRRLRDPAKRRVLIIVAAVTMAAFAGLVWWIVSDVDQNQEKIAAKADRGEVFKLLARQREQQRRACGVVNRRFSVLADLVAEQPPSALAYYREHPEELPEAMRRFRETLRILRPRNCRREYPPPNPAKFGLKGKAPAPPARTRSRSRPRTPDRARPAPSSPPERQSPGHPTGHRRPPNPRPAPAPSAPAPSPSPPIPSAPRPAPPDRPPVPPSVRDRICSADQLRPILPIC